MNKSTVQSAAAAFNAAAFNTAHIDLYLAVGEDSGAVANLTVLKVIVREKLQAEAVRLVPSLFRLCFRALIDGLCIL